MLIKRPSDIHPSEITGHGVYLRRRELLAGGAAAALGLAFTLGGCKARAGATGSGNGNPPAPPTGGGRALPPFARGPYGTSEAQTPFKDVTTYNNFYEFGTDKSAPSENAHTLRTRPWTVAFEGEIRKPQVVDVDTLLKWAPL